MLAFTGLRELLIVEHPGWFYTYRRLSKDYEYLTATSEAMIHVVMIHIMVWRIALKIPF